MVILAFNDKTGESDFDFDFEARMAAVNEACEDMDTAINCTYWELCPACEALRKVIENKLRKAFTAGRVSAGASDVSQEDIDE